MAFETGTATSAEDLLTKFKTFITTSASLAAEVPSQVWAVEEDTTVIDVNGSNDRELYLRGPGLGNTDNIHVNIRLFNDVAAGSDAWSWLSYGATSYNSTLTISQQPGVNQSDKVMPLFNQSMQYWFFANGRRFIIIANVTASVYANCYCGFILPFSPSVTALEYRYPLYIGASMGEVGKRFSDTNNGDHRSFWDPANQSTNFGSGEIYTPGNTWLQFRNVNTSGTKEVSINSVVGVGITAPYSSIYFHVNQLRVENIEPLLGGDYLLTDVTLMRSTLASTLRERFGVLDGVAHLSGISQSSQNSLTVGADTYLVFQEAFRTGQGDFVAIKQEV